MSLEKFAIDFENREKQLENILRWNMERRTPMFYRTNDLLHSRRVHFLVKDILPILEKVYVDDFNVDKSLYLALVHDDAEIITGDVQLYYKDRMSSGEQKKLVLEESKAIDKLVEKWPKSIGEFSYGELLYNALHKNCLEAKFVSYCDKVDGYCESLHEIFAGNPRFVGASQSYVEKLMDFPRKFPELSKLIPSSKHPLLEAPNFLDTEKVLENAKFHTRESIKIPTGLFHYDVWRELTLKHFGEEPLIQVKEY